MLAGKVIRPILYSSYVLNVALVGPRLNVFTRVGHPVSDVQRQTVKDAPSQTRGPPSQKPGETLSALRYRRSEERLHILCTQLRMLELSEGLLEMPWRAMRTLSRPCRHLP